MMSEINKKMKVFVGMSGGVDSSVSAALLKKQGYDVTGVFIKVWQPDWIECTWKEDRLDAMRVAAKLEIPFVTLDLEKEYKHDVVDYMLNEYKNGRTPNPDVMCNKSVKFGGFLRYALDNGADYIATGHYARVEHTKAGSILLKGIDENKDQSYFLWTLTQEQLKHTLFPIGHLKKPEVRELAQKFGLMNADKKDSQGLCFIGKVDMKDFLKRYIPVKQGDVCNEAGDIIGHHDGAFFYTVGERHGFIITQKGTSDEPYYIVRKSIPNNILYVSHRKPDSNLQGDKNRVKLVQVSWTHTTPGQSASMYDARVRYRGQLIPCTLHDITKTSCTIKFADHQKSVTSGQSAVVYRGEECIGGGIITE